MVRQLVEHIAAPSGRLLQCTVLLLAGFLAACAGPASSQQPSTRTESPRATSERRADGPSLEEIPLDTSAIAAVVNSRVVLATRSMGEVPFDGQVLPILSPDGRFLATQIGEAPDWASLLGSPGQSVSIRTEVVSYDLTARPPRRIRWRESLPAGVLLGRSADDAGFLIEQVRPDASRRVGKVNWVSGEVTWLTADGAVYAGATLLPNRAAASLATTSRDIDDTRRALLLSGNGGRDVRAEPQVSYLMPVGTADSEIMMVIAQSSIGSELLAMRVSASGSGAQPRSVVLARRPISDSAEPIVAYQAMSPLQTPLPLPPETDGEQPPGLLFFHPAASRMAVFDLSNGAIVLLADQSIAGAWHMRRTASGTPVWSVFLTTPEGLRHQTVIRRNRVLEASPAARVSEEVWVPRSTTDASRPYILIGPSPRDPRSLMLVEMRPTDPLR